MQSTTCLITTACFKRQHGAISSLTTVLRAYYVLAQYIDGTILLLGHLVESKLIYRLIKGLIPHGHGGALAVEMSDEMSDNGRLPEDNAEFLDVSRRCGRMWRLLTQADALSRTSSY